MNDKEVDVTWKGWLSLIVLIVIISGVFKNLPGGLSSLDFTNLTGVFRQSIREHEFYR